MSFFTKKKQSSEQKSDINISLMEQKNNPYLDARREWDERFGSFIDRANNWRLIAILSTSTLALTVCGLVYLASTTKVLPYIVEIDGFGRQVGGGFINDSAAASDVVTKAALSRFVTDLRSVVTDGIIQRQMIDRVYAHIASGSAAQTQISDFYRNDPPQRRAATQIVTVDIAGAHAPSPTTYEIEWIETNRNLQGKVISTDRWRASLTVQVSPPRDNTIVYENPLGIFVTAVSWSKVVR